MYSPAQKEHTQSDTVDVLGMKVACLLRTPWRKDMNKEEVLKIMDTKGYSSLKYEREEKRES